MGIEEKINKENERDESSLFRMSFFVDNGGWWRAYEWSAYLAHFFPNDLSEENRLKGLKKKLKNGIVYVYVGVKLDSFKKYFPLLSIEEPNDMGDGVININVADFFQDSGIVFEKYKEVLEEWKDGINFPKDKEKTNIVGQSSSSLSTPFSLTGIFHRIMEYPLEEKSMIDNVKFIRELKNEIISII